MKQKIASLRAAVAGAIRRFFYERPAVKRAGLVSVLLVPFFMLSLTFGSFAIFSIWALMLLSLFWGMGAERAALEWDATFSLPPISSFAFWRWQPLEKKRFLATISACATFSLSILVWETLA